MRRLWFVICIIFWLAVSSCTANPLDALVPDSSIKGSLKNFTVTDIQVQTRKAINGGVYVQGTVIVPFDFKKEQVKPTLLAAIKGLKEKYKDCEWIGVFAQVAKGHYAGRAEYAQKKIEINYNILSDDELKERNRNAKKNGLDIIRMPTKEEFDQAVLIDETRQRLYTRIQDEEIKASRDPQKRKAKKPRLTQAENFDDIIMGMTAKELGIPKDKAAKTRNILGYYQASYASETIGPL